MTPRHASRETHAPRWAGPRYLRPANKARDLRFVLAHLAAIAKTNASMAAGLGACVEDCQRLPGALGNFRRAALRVFLMAGALLAWNIWPALALLEPSRDMLLNDIGIGMVALEVVFFLLLILWAIRRRRRPVTPAASTAHRFTTLEWAFRNLGLVLDVLLALLLAAGIAVLGVWLAVEEGELYFGVLVLLFEALLIVSLVLLFRRRGWRGGPLAHALGGPVRAGRAREQVLVGLREVLERGDTLGEAMREMSRFFPPHAAGRVLAAERTGQIAPCLAEVASEIDDALRLRAALPLRRAYLIMGVLLQSLVVAFLLVKVIPVFVEIFEEFSADAPTQLRALIATGDYLLYRWPHLVTGIALGFILFRLALRCVPGARWCWARLLLILPAAGAARRYRGAAQSARMLGDLLHAGMPVPEALELCAEAGPGPAHAAVFRRWKEKAGLGAGLGECAAALPCRAVIPAGFAAAAQLGEQTGAPREALQHAADHYDQCARRASALADTLAYIAVLAPLAFITYFVATAVYSTLSGLTDALFYSL